MAHTVAQLIEILQGKEQNELVEYVVVKTDGELVTVDVQQQAKPMAKMLKMFGG